MCTITQYVMDITTVVTEWTSLTAVSKLANRLRLNTEIQQKPFYPTALKGCQGIVFTHDVRMGGRVAGNSLSRLYLRNRKVLEVDTW